MEEISLKGEKYIKASVIADKLGYTADYVGQLCRSKQVDATLVGRSWYVSEKSISQHKKNRYRSTLSKSKESVRKIAEERTTFRNSGYSSKKTSYGQDDADLIPIIVKDKNSETTKNEIFDRDSYPRKAEDKPVNNHSLNLSEKYPNIKKISNNTTRALPPVRIISTRSVDMNTMAPKPRHSQLIARKPASRHAEEGKGFLLSLVAWICLLAVSVTLFVVVISLEKKVVITDNSSEVVLYNLSLDPFKDFMNAHFKK